MLQHELPSFCLGTDSASGGVAPDWRGVSQIQDSHGAEAQVPFQGKRLGGAEVTRNSLMEAAGMFSE